MLTVLTSLSFATETWSPKQYEVQERRGFRYPVEHSGRGEADVREWDRFYLHHPAPAVSRGRTILFVRVSLSFPSFFFLRSIFWIMAWRRRWKRNKRYR